MIKEKLIELKKDYEHKRDYYGNLISQKDTSMLIVYNDLCKICDDIDNLLSDEDLMILDLVKEKAYHTEEVYYSCGDDGRDRDLDCIKLFVSERDNRFRSFYKWLGKEEEIKQ